MRTDTVTATLTELDVLIIEQQNEIMTEALLELDRYLGTIETYGGYCNTKPDYSWKVRE